MFNGNFKNKKVLITGNTGFKGTWLSLWLEMLGADVYGYSIDIPTSPSLNELLPLLSKSKTYFGDVADHEQFQSYFNNVSPDFVFHLAAQPIVSRSFENPIKTIRSNCLGTASVLDALRQKDVQCVAVLITSDKSYDNKEWVWGYKETDQFGGSDIYSGSKGAAELIIKSYFKSFLSASGKVKIGVGRAGNVIGGGDWAENRIVVDCFKAWEKNRSVMLRSKHSTRPWQHVLEPLSGYLQLASKLHEGVVANGEDFNFGPQINSNKTVLEVVEFLNTFWEVPLKCPVYLEESPNFSESKLLSLNCEKAKAILNWGPVLTFNETIEFVGEWYNEFYNSKSRSVDRTSKQLERYIDKATNGGFEWAN